MSKPRDELERLLTGFAADLRKFMTGQRKALTPELSGRGWNALDAAELALRQIDREKREQK